MAKSTIKGHFPWQTVTVITTGYSITRHLLVVQGLGNSGWSLEDFNWNLSTFNGFSFQTSNKSIDRNRFQCIWFSKVYGPAWPPKKWVDKRVAYSFSPQTFMCTIGYHPNNHIAEDLGHFCYPLDKLFGCGFKKGLMMYLTIWYDIIYYTII